MKKISFSAGLLALVLSACSPTDSNEGQAASSEQNASLPGKGISVQALQSTITEETFQTEIINILLQELGYDVKPIKQVDYGAAYAAVASGDATYLAVNWDPQHEGMYQNAGGDTAFYREGEYVTGAAQGYLIDKKTADQYGITNIEQFKDPKIARLFDSDGDGKADLIGCQPGWSCEAMIEHQLPAYGLTETITHHQGQYAPMIADVLARHEKGEPIFYYTWTPYWLSGRLVPGKDVIWLQVPFSATPDGIDTALPNGQNYGFAVNSERIVANKKFAQDNPAAAKLFAIAQLPINDISAENMLIEKGEDSPNEIRRHAENWIEANRATVDEWLQQARSVQP